MKIDEIVISRAIVEGFCKELVDSTKTDVAVVGGGPAGLTASYYLAKEGIKTVLFERKLSIGGGMWGGGMMFNKCVFQKESKRILDELEINTKKCNFFI